MTISVESNGPMDVILNTGVPKIGVDLKVTFDGAPKGRLTITNDSTGATKSYTVAQLTNGQVVWDWDVDDASAAAGNTMTVEYYGAAGLTFNVNGYDSSGGFAGPTMFYFSGNGVGKCSGKTVYAA